jgi:hypothetical protein
MTQLEKPRRSVAASWMAAAFASSLATARAASPAACVTAGMVVGFDNDFMGISLLRICNFP